jgi:hypothetical protein
MSLASTEGGVALPATTLPLTGTGVAPLAWSPSPLALGNVAVGNQGGVTETLTVTNRTSQPITLGVFGYDRTASTTGNGILEFTLLSSSTCQVGTVLDAEASCDFVVHITYSVLGAFSDTFSLASTDASDTALSAAILPLTGTGIQ